MSVLPSLDSKYPALILAADRYTQNHGALGIARSLGRLGVPIYAVVDGVIAPVAASRYIAKALVWKKWPAERDEFVNAMSAISEIIAYPTILIPMDDLCAISVAENATALNRWFLIPQLPQDLPGQLANKASFYRLCTEIGVPCARSIVPRSAEEICEFIEQTSLPILVKATEQWRRLRSDIYCTSILVHSHRDLLDIYERNKSEESSTMILQEYIPGEDWLYNGYCNFRAGLYLGFTGKKVVNYPKEAGSSAIGISLENEELRFQAERFLKAISYSGICDLDWRRDERDGQYKIVDCNPRVGANFEMFENERAIDVVRALHLDLTGRRIDCAPMIESRLFTAEPLCLRSILRDGHSSALRAIASPPIATIKLAWWSSDDPLPFFTMSMRFILGAITRRFLRVIEFTLWAVHIGFCRATILPVRIVRLAGMTPGRYIHTKQFNRRRRQVRTFAARAAHSRRKIARKG